MNIYNRIFNIIIENGDKRSKKTKAADDKAAAKKPTKPKPQLPDGLRQAAAGLMGLSIRKQK
tara:strand:- start:817 stop:1002 length:186 start_codon:yes stop_codon:yes gene_type:complete